MDEVVSLEESLGQHIGDSLVRDSEPQKVPVNMYPTTGALVVVAPLPGVMAEDVEIEIEGTRLTLRAAMRTTAPKDYIMHEWHYGPYERSVGIPGGFGGEVTASFGNGQLAVRIERGDTVAERRTVTLTD